MVAAFCVVRRFVARLMAINPLSTGLCYSNVWGVECEDLATMFPPIRSARRCRVAVSYQVFIIKGLN